MKLTRVETESCRGLNGSPSSDERKVSDLSCRKSCATALYSALNFKNPVTHPSAPTTTPAPRMTSHRRSSAATNRNGSKGSDTPAFAGAGTGTVSAAVEVNAWFGAAGGALSEVKLTR